MGWVLEAFAHPAMLDLERIQAEQERAEQAAAPGTFLTSRTQDGVQQNGTPCYKSICIEEARRGEDDINRADPLGTRDWDHAADRRQVAWETCRFSKSLTQLFRTKYEVTV